MTFHHYAKDDSIDWWLEQGTKCVAVAEMKCRDCLPKTYPTIYLAMRKYIALTIAQLRGPTGLFIVGFSDGSAYTVRVHDIDTRQKVVVRGRFDRPGVPNDREPCIEVPMSDMTRVFP
jgi:hypothetical protein